MTVPRVKETKTTRERIQYLKQSRLPPNERKKKTPYETYSTKESELKMRRSWDLRGRMTDMETLLNQNSKRIGQLSKSNAIQNFADLQEHDQLKRALAQLRNLETEHKSIKMQHKQNIKAIQAQHRIHTQELNDESVIYKSREKTFEIHVNDMEIKYRTMLDIVNQNREKKQDMVTELEMLTNRSRHLDNEIGGLASELSKSNHILNNSEDIIQRDRTELIEVDKYVERLQKKVKKAHEIRDRLLETVKDLEESKQSRSWLLAHQADGDVSEPIQSDNKNSYYYDEDS